MMQNFLKYVGKDKANGFSVYGWSAGLVFAQAANAAVAKGGINGLTRAHSSRSASRPSRASTPTGCSAPTTSRRSCRRHALCSSSCTPAPSSAYTPRGGVPSTASRRTAVRIEADLLGGDRHRDGRDANALIVRSSRRRRRGGRGLRHPVGVSRWRLRADVPVVGLGTWALDDVVEAPDPAAAVARRRWRWGRHERALLPARSRVGAPPWLRVPRRPVCAGIVERLAPVRERDGLVLEFGCGSGLLTRYLVDAGFRVRDEWSPAMLELARHCCRRGGDRTGHPAGRSRSRRRRGGGHRPPAELSALRARRRTRRWWPWRRRCAPAGLRHRPV